MAGGGFGRPGVEGTGMGREPRRARRDFGEACEERFFASFATRAG
jgi:hypothetical protein